MRYAAAVKALKLTVAIGIALSIYAVIAQSTIHFEDYMNPGRVIPGWVRFSWAFSRVWWMGGWIIVLAPINLIAALWINERMRQKEKRQKASAAANQLS